MFSELNRPSHYILSRRLAEAEARVRGISPAVRQEYLAEVTTFLNDALSQGDGLSRKHPVVRNAPVRPEQVDGNFAILARDMEWLAGHIQSAYEESIRLFNEFAGVQATLRRYLRNMLHRSGGFSWQLSLTDPMLIGSVSAHLDTISGFAALPVSAASEIRPSSVRLGVGSEGKPQDGTSMDALFDGRPDTALIWHGPRLEIVLEFSQQTVLNALALEVIGSDGLVIEELVSTADEAVEESWLADLPGGSFALDGSASKFSGEWLYLFRPRFAKRMRLVLADRFGLDPIQVSGIRLMQYSFMSRGQLDTVRIGGFSGQVRFEAEQAVWPPQLQVTHWISHDGVTYDPVSPGERIRIQETGFWYRAQLIRSDSSFEVSASDLVLPGYNAAGEPVLPERMHSVDLGGGLFERSLFYSSLQGELVFREAVLPNSLHILHGGMELPVSQWMFSSGRLLLSGVLSSGVEIRYRTDSRARQWQPRLAPFASPVLYGIRMEF